jgi:hypothetical protein
VIVVTESRADALTRLDVFVGEWVVEARFPGGDGATARSWFEWALDRQFLIQRTEVPVPEAPDGLMIVSADLGTGAYTQHYYDSRGVVRLYAMTFAGGVWTLTRESPDFTPWTSGSVSPARSARTGTPSAVPGRAAATAAGGSTTSPSPTAGPADGQSSPGRSVSRSSAVSMPLRQTERAMILLGSTRSR